MTIQTWYHERELRRLTGQSAAEVMVLLSRLVRLVNERAVGDSAQHPLRIEIYQTDEPKALSDYAPELDSALGLSVYSGHE